MLEIAEQAGLKKDHASDREYLGNFDWRLFCDLIVRDCSYVAKVNQAENMDWDISEILLEHFGVEVEFDPSFIVRRSE
jgi:hypothetical protein